ncbi:MAG: DUF169 domain-containing protein [Candidatus Methylomirabilales bacterium]
MSREIGGQGGPALTYAGMQDLFERTLKLQTPPVAVKFIKPGEEKPSGLVTNIKAMTFCQAVTVARQGGYPVYLERRTLSCHNARIAFGLGTPEEIERDIQTAIETTTGKYAPTPELARKIVLTKFRIGAGEVAGVGVAPMGKAQFVPDALIFTCAPWQAYYLTNAYLWMTGDIPVRFEAATNSLVCAYSAGLAGWKKQLNCCTACTGGRAYGGTESTEVYWSTPWGLVDLLIEGVKQRSRRTPYPSLITIPLPAPAPEKHFFGTREEA